MAPILCALVLGPAGGAASRADPGISASTILVGAVTTEAARSASITRGAGAYFAWVNARGGVAGRTLDYRVLDDGGDPAETLGAARRLVQSDRVFAIVSPAGAEHVGTVRDYLNRARVPQLFAASCASALGRDSRRYPWTIGFQPSCHSEGRVYGRYVAASTTKARIAVLSEDDAYGRELVEGLRRGISRGDARIVGVAGYDPAFADIPTAIRALRASRANVLAVFGTLGVAREASAAARRLGWRPRIVNSAFSSRLAPGAVERRSGAGVPGSIAFTFLRDPTASRDDPGMRLYRSILSRHAKGANPDEIGHLYGMAVAHEVVALVRRLGRNPTRAALMAAARSITSPANPFVLPGVGVRTGRRDGFPIEQGRLHRWTNGRWTPFGGLWSWDRD